MSAEAGCCPRCLRPLDDHCWLHEPVILCPVNRGGALVTPCKASGPKGQSK